MILSKTLGRDHAMIMSVATKVVLQMTCKMGGELWAVHIPVEFFVAHSYYMYFSLSDYGPVSRS